MRIHNNLFKAMLVGSILAAACLPAPSSAAEQTRSFYQNTSASCHGETPADEGKLARTEQRMKNTSVSDATVVCSLQTDPLAVMTPDFETVDYVAVWGKLSAPAAPALRTGGTRKMSLLDPRPPGNDWLSCTLVTSYADDGGTQRLTKTITGLPVATLNGAQGVIEWFPADHGRVKFLAPINLSCIVPPGVEMNDWLVVYQVDVGL